MEFDDTIAPWWVENAGTIAILITASLLLLALSFFPIAPVVTAPATISSTAAPSIVRARTGGSILELYENGGAKVRAGDVLALIGQAGDQYKLRNAQRISQFGVSEQSIAADVPADLASAFGALLRSSLERRRLESREQLTLEREELELRIHEGQARRSVAKQRLQNHERLRAIEQQRLSASMQLVERGFYSPAAIDFVQRNALIQENEGLQAKMEVAAASADLSRFRLQLTSLQRAHREELERQEALEAAAQLEFKGALAAWADRHLLEAPVGGRIFYFRQITSGSDLNDGESVGLVTPSSHAFQATVYLPAGTAKRPSLGDSVNVTIGTNARAVRLSGTVSYVSAYIRDGVYYVSITLPNTYRFETNLEGMPATAEFAPAYTTPLGYLLTLFLER